MGDVESWRQRMRPDRLRGQFTRKLQDCRVLLEKLNHLIRKMEEANAWERRAEYKDRGTSFNKTIAESKVILDNFETGKASRFDVDTAIRNLAEEEQIIRNRTGIKQPEPKIAPTGKILEFRKVNE